MDGMGRTGGHLLTGSEMQWFESSDTESAIAWARDG
jgi:hypothetical protein